MRLHRSYSCAWLSNKMRGELRDQSVSSERAVRHGRVGARDVSILPKGFHKALSISSAFEAGFEIT